jgi:hypothetical protein
MGIEIRRVPGKWEHPKNKDGHYIPLFEDNFDAESAEWEKDKNDWLAGIRPEGYDEVSPSPLRSYIEYAGSGPDAAKYANYKGEDCTHFALYETYTEGTPLTPSFAKLKELEDHLVMFGAGGRKYTREVASGICGPNFVGEATYQLEKARATLDAMKAIKQQLSKKRLKP